MKYDNYIKTIADRFTTYLDEIATEHNFEHGPEFEIAICKTLRRALPSKYGVCRGYLVAADGDKAGDDIIIYNRERFPTLRMIDNEAFAQRENIPIDAAYAYIEAKNTLILSGKKETFDTAIKQVAKAKSLVERREAIDVTKAIDPYIVMNHLRPIGRKHWPRICNPFFTAIISRHVRQSGSTNPLTGLQVCAALNGYEIPDENPPDLIIAGEDVVGLPFVNNKDENTETYDSPFMVSEAHFSLIKQPGLAFAIGFCSLIYALETIHLGIMPWPAIIGDAISAEITSTK
ncbi:MAG: hypothetical protein IH984_07775 [Planctomycetes bacterium]|nr:hypothetical protein [Planctomycetota bacterium]